ncbi:MAG: dTMP kinase [Burkholderiales bacterium]|nr:dTMP kinase [Burkholderiales bacterium]
MRKGLFLSVEGIDGAGKSSHVDFIMEYLQNKGLEVVKTREPGGTKLGEDIRNLLLNSESMNQTSELLLYFASRQELIEQVIVPNLNNGVCVLADRFVDSSIAYQGSGRMLGVEKVKTVYSLLEPHIKPDLTFLFDAPLHVAMERLNSARTKDRIEKESLEFFERVQNSYYKLAEENSDRIKLISTEGKFSETRKKITEYLDLLLEKQ